MTKSATRIQDKDTQKRLSVVQSKDDPTKYGIVILNPDGTPIGGGGGGGSGDVSGPASSTDGDVVLFDGATGKRIKDSGVKLSSKLDATALSNNAYGGGWNGDTTHTPTKDALYDKMHTMDVEIGNKAADTSVVKLTGNQTISGTKTFGTSPVVPSKTSDATNTGTAIATEAQVYNVAEDVATINGKIPSAATSSNQLADKDYVNDSINSITAYYITKNAQGDQFATYAELAAATTFYSGGVARVPTRNDYCIVVADENHDNATTRYIYQNNQWEYQYTVNETALTTAQLNALNSGITSAKVSTYDGYASTIAGKQDALNEGEGIEIGTIQDYSAMKGPAPSGFHVPLDSEWVALCGILTTTFSMASDATTMGTYLKMPMAGRRYNSSANVTNVGAGGYYCSSTPFEAGYAYDLRFNSSSINPQDPQYRAHGFSVRCFKDTPIIPTSSWTTLYQGSGSAGVFYNATDGLISVSGDGVTWYTIQDKNLGATTVFNQGDAETDTNCGYFYQWGNNYGFPHSGAVTTSSTQVNASNYGPGNYYSSSTFITGSYDRSSVQNDNLWGATTGVVTLNNAISNTGVLSVNGHTGELNLYSTISVTLTTAGWSASTQTVTATGVTASNTVICSPAPSSISDYSDNGVYCSAQSTDSLTFTCDSTPSNDITVNVVIMN